MAGKGQDVTERYIAETIEAATRGDTEAAEEVMALFRSAVDSRQIDGITRGQRRLAEYVAECFWKFDQGETVGKALGIEKPRGVGQPKGSTKVSQDSYAALLVLLARRMRSANKAKDYVLREEQDKDGKGMVSRRTLDTIYATYAPVRAYDHDLLVVMLSPAHRKLFGKSLR